MTAVSLIVALCLVSLLALFLLTGLIIQRRYLRKACSQAYTWRLNHQKASETCKLLESQVKKLTNERDSVCEQYTALLKKWEEDKGVVRELVKRMADEVAMIEGKVQPRRGE